MDKSSSSSSNIFLHLSSIDKFNLLFSILHVNVAAILLGFQLNDSIISLFGPLYPTAILQVTFYSPTKNSPHSQVPSRRFQLTTEPNTPKISILLMPWSHHSIYIPLPPNPTHLSPHNPQTRRALPFPITSSKKTGKN